MGLAVSPVRLHDFHELLDLLKAKGTKDASDAGNCSVR